MFFQTECGIYDITEQSFRICHPFLTILNILANGRKKTINIPKTLRLVLHLFSQCKWDSGQA